MNMKERGKVIVTVICCIVLFIPVFCRDVAIAEDTTGAQDEEVLKQLLDVKVSTASRYAQTLNEAPASVTIITSEDIERFGLRTIDDILMRVRGFYITNDHNYSYLGVRGFSRPSDYNNRIRLLINGVPTNENVFGSSSIGTEFGLDVDAIERIEIVRGPGSALYGSSAMLAVVNVITKNGKTTDGTKLTLQAGDMGTIRAGIRLGKELKNGLDFFLSAHAGYIKGQGYYFKEFDIPGVSSGISKNNDKDSYMGIFATAKYKDFSLLCMMSSRQKYIPTAPYETAFNDPRTRTTDAQRLIELKYTRDITYNTHIMVREYLNGYFYKGVFPYDQPQYTTLQQDKANGQLFGFEAQFGWDTRADNRLIAGIEYIYNYRSSYAYWDEFEIHFDKNYPYHQWSVYIQDELQVLKNLSFTLGARYDKFSDRGQALSPRAAVIFNPFHSTTFKLLYGDAFRAPNFYELYYEVINEARSNPGLKGEKIHAYEAVWEQRFGKEISFIISLYRFDMKGLIEQVPDPVDELLQFQNFQKVNGKGIEAEWNIRLKNGLLGFIDYSYQRSKNIDLHKELSNSPSHLLKTGLSIPLLKNYTASCEMFYESSRITIDDNIRTRPFFLVNFHLAARTLFDRLKFSFRVKNLFDKKYSLPGGYEHIQESLIQAGRSFTLKVEYAL
jgi:outer membrane receptor for ferrienterochelin and colicins